MVRFTRKIDTISRSIFHNANEKLYFTKVLVSLENNAFAVGDTDTEPTANQ